MSCSSSRTSYIVSCEYDKSKNVTYYSKFPLGSVYIPGEWQQTTYNSTSKQQYFINKDSVIIAIAIVPSNGFEFNQDNSKKGFEFTKSFYEWDSEYLSKTHGLQVNIEEEDPVKNYIIWTIQGNVDNNPIQCCFLFGESNNVAKNYSVQVAKGWDGEQIVSFLRSLYLNN
ncbi:hypothetical protein D0T56_01795 [Dysgonomonas sp. 520]|nr:hypothetical protein [Dysgonomonas sp. 520]